MPASAPLTARLRSWSRRPETALFVLVFGVYAYFYQGGGWNQSSRFDLVRALVEQGTACIDDYEFNTGDKARRNGHTYSDKAPGVSWLSVPVYAAAYPFAGGQRPKARLVTRAAYVATLLTVSLPSALTAVTLAGLGAVLGWPRRLGFGLAVAWALGTLAFPYATLLYGHQLAAALLFGAFVWIFRCRLEGCRPWRLAAAGLFLGYAVAVEYPAAIGVALLVGYAFLVIRPWPRLGWLLGGMAPPLAALAAYHTVVFGGPLHLPYNFAMDAPRRLGAFVGISELRLEILWGILFSDSRGLFFWSPWLLLAIPGIVKLVRGRALRPEGVLVAGMLALFAVFNMSLSTTDTDWLAGWGIGARHLVVTLPFLTIAVGAFFPRAARPPSRGLLWQGIALAAGVLVAFSTAVMLMATAVRPEVPVMYRRPIPDFVVPAFLDGDLAQNTMPIHTSRVKERREAWNVGMLLGLSGVPSLLPLFAFGAAAGAWLLGALRRSDENAPAGAEALVR